MKKELMISAFTIGVACLGCKLYGKQIKSGLNNIIYWVNRLENTKIYFFKDKNGKIQPVFLYEPKP